MKRHPWAVPLALLASVGCGETSAKVLERLDAAMPPTSNLRMDVLLVRALSTCVIGSPCRLADSSQCYAVTDGNGGRIAFDPSSVQLLAPSDPKVSNAAQVACMRLPLDDADVALANQLIAGLRTRVFQLTGGDINLDVHTHELAPLEASFVTFSAGPFLEPPALEAAALEDVNRDTDFVFAFTGYRDPDSGLSPQANPCVGTNWIEQGPFGGSTFTWLSLASACARPATVFSAWLVQLYFGLRDVNGFGDVATDSFPACGRGGPDPTRWFPFVDGCTSDPDASSCGLATCPDRNAFNEHVLSAHWPRGRAFNGNYCADGRMDFDETGVDSGGRCDRIGR
ncbi:MAG TPA: hypothetical protein VHU40_10515 [Polyangia bacterium]|nr:hypothetical protein [Polyangia bacterium]